MASGKKEPEQREGDYEIYLMRHGIAADREPGGSSDDAKRPLTLEGKLKLRSIAKGLKRMEAEWDWIVTSPLKRAVETADVVAEELGTAAPRDLCEALVPGDGSAQKVIAFLAQHPERSRVLMVGHEPSLSELASELIGANRSAHLGFKKGGCCLITYGELPTTKSPGLLAWWLTPKLLRKLGG
jgi:phosphohistidine phosphatase